MPPLQTPQHNQTRASSPGRRQADQECAAHEERLDAMERKLAWQKGAMYIASGCLTFGMAIFGWMGNAIYNKVTAIETMINQGAVSSSVMATKYESLEKRVQAIEERHTYESQNGIRK